MRGIVGQYHFIEESRLQHDSFFALYQETMGKVANDSVWIIERFDELF